MSYKIIGTGLHQVPTNSDLGTLAYVDHDSVGELRVDKLYVGDVGHNDNEDYNLTIARTAGGNGVLKLYGDNYYAGNPHMRWQIEPTQGGTLKNGLMTFDGDQIKVSTFKVDSSLGADHVTNMPTMQIYHYNYPDDGTYNVPALQIRSGNTDADAKHHGFLSLEQIFTGSATHSPMLQFKTNANNSNDKGVVMLQGISGNSPGLIVYSDLIGASESNIDLNPYDIFYTGPNGAYLRTTNSASLGTGQNALRLINDRAGTEDPGINGAGLVFEQRWYNASTDNVRVGGIFGNKTGGDGIFGGGLDFYVQPHNGNNLTKLMQLRGESIVNIYGSVYQGTTYLGWGNNYSNTGEITNCPFTHTRLQQAYNAPYSYKYQCQLSYTVGAAYTNVQKYLHFITSSSKGSRIKIKVHTTRSGSERSFGSFSVTLFTYSEGDGDFRHWAIGEVENIRNYGSIGTWVNELPQGYLVDYASNLNASSETSRRPDNNQWDYSVIRIPFMVNSQGSGDDELYITLEEDTNYGNEPWWVGVI